MTPADLARFELAKRAYKATQPNLAEVQAGVRRARLSLPRPKARRSWFSKGLVFVVLAIGSLAYAKPHALTDLVGDMLPRDRGGAKAGHKPGAGVALPPVVANAPTSQGRASLQRATSLPAELAAQPAPSPAAVAPSVKPRPTPLSSRTPSGSNADGVHQASKGESAAKSAAAGAPQTSAAVANPANSNDAAADDADSATLSNWGRVGQALAHGDEASALTVLDQLSQSTDVRTRDKADLGRAQLLMAQGNTEAACSLARSLTHRRAGGRIERQALGLLKSCEP